MLRSLARLLWSPRSSRVVGAALPLVELLEGSQPWILSTRSRLEHVAGRVRSLDIRCVYVPQKAASRRLMRRDRLCPYRAVSPPSGAELPRRQPSAGAKWPPLTGSLRPSAVPRLLRTRPAGPAQPSAPRAPRASGGRPLPHLHSARRAAHGLPCGNRPCGRVESLARALSLVCHLYIIPALYPSDTTAYGRAHRPSEGRDPHPPEGYGIWRHERVVAREVTAREVKMADSGRVFAAINLPRGGLNGTGGAGWTGARREAVDERVPPLPLSNY